MYYQSHNYFNLNFYNKKDLAIIIFFKHHLSLKKNSPPLMR